MNDTLSLKKVGSLWVLSGLSPKLSRTGTVSFESKQEAISWATWMAGKAVVCE